MAKIETHIKDCINILGEGFEEIHKWLDAYAKKYNPFLFLERHRQYRHHAAAIEYIEKKYGHYASKAAKLHIIRDNALYVYCNMDTLREDEIDEYYQKALKFCHPVPKNDKWKKDIDEIS
jgi:hypothetical protein